MPNWCHTNIDFYGSKNDVEKLYNLIKKSTDKSLRQSDFGNLWLGNICIGTEIVGINDILNTKIVKCRGSLTDMHMTNDLDRVESHLYITTETAWVPMMKMWTMILDKYDLDLELIYYAEEPGCELFWTNDPASEEQPVDGYDGYEWTFMEVSDVDAY